MFLTQSFVRDDKPCLSKTNLMDRNDETLSGRKEKGSKESKEKTKGSQESKEKTKGSKEDKEKDKPKKSKEADKKGKDYANDEDYEAAYEDNHVNVVPASVNQQRFVVPKDEDYRKIIIKSRPGDRFDVQVQGV